LIQHMINAQPSLPLSTRDYATLSLPDEVPKNVMTRFPFYFVVGFLACAGLSAAAQIVNLDNNTVTPSFGAGHSYIQDAFETVNPASGSVSLRMKLPTPPGRGLNLPFSINYNSSTAVQLLPLGYTPDPTVDGDPNAIWSEQTSSIMGYSAGWSYGLPEITASIFTANCPSNPGSTYEGTANYFFTDSSGSSHPLNISSSNDQCGTGTPPGTPSSGDNHYTATLVGDCSNCTTYRPPLLVADSNGTSYYFSEPGNEWFQMQGTGQSNSFIGGSFPDYIEDRNGNKITQTTSGQTISFQDTLGRPLLSLPVTNGSTTSIQVGNLTYQLTWINISGSYSVNPVQENATSGVRCAGVPQVTFTATVISSITLPNGDVYQFHYNSWGLLSEIDYPGSWVKYQWKLSDQPSDHAAFDGAYSIPPNWTYYINACQYIYQSPVVGTRSVGLAGSSTPTETQQFSYATQWGSDYTTWTSKQTTVATTDNIRSLTSTTIYNYSPMDTGNSSTALPSGGRQPSNVVGFPRAFPGHIAVESSIQYFDWGNTSAPIKTVSQTWADQFNLSSSTTTLPNGLSSQQQYTYYPPYSVVTEKDEYDFGQSSPTRITATSYQALAGNPVAPTGNTQFFYLPQSVIVCSGAAGAGNCTSSSTYKVAETDYSYDQTAIAAASGLPTSTHDETYYSASSSTPRGNVTTKTRWSSTETSPKSTYTYDETGQVLSMTEPCGNAACSDMSSGGGHTTTYSYSDNPSGSNPGGGNSNAYPTKITYPAVNGVVHQESFSYNYGTGLLASSTDENSNTTSYAYNDPLNRMTKISYPDRGQTLYTYNDSEPSPSITTTQTINSSTTKTSVSIMDGMWRVVRTELTSDPAGTDYVDTAYDGMGRIYTQTNPYRTTSDSTYGISTNTYDALGRTVAQQQPDGSFLTWCYDGVASVLPKGAMAVCNSQIGSSTTGTWVDSTDENGNDWQRTYDALGRMNLVLEPSGSSQAPTMQTSYSYDVLGNLRSVTQNGQSGSTARSRSFTYDSLSRLIQAFNPESGWTCYGTTGGALPNGSNCTEGYDGNGNVASKTDARGVTTNYIYDALNRILSKTYTNAPAGTLSNCYQYDTATNGIGHLGAEWTQSGGCASSPSANSQSLRAFGAYDAMGRIVSEQQCVAGHCTSTAVPSTPTPNCTSLSGGNGLQYCYDLSGNLLAYGNGVTSMQAENFSNAAMAFSQSFDAAGRLATVGSSWVNSSNPTYPATLFTGEGYTPFNTLSSWLLGGNLWSSRSYDKRLRICQQLSMLQQTSAPVCQ
jgi:YD repeat-containing protein